MGFSWESFGLGPMTTRYRTWFIERINKEIAKSAKEDGTTDDIPTKAAHHNMPDVRALMNKTRHFNRNPRLNRPASSF
jgi:phage anti-repressor protein